MTPPPKPARSPQALLESAYSGGQWRSVSSDIAPDQILQFDNDDAFHSVGDLVSSSDAGLAVQTRFNSPPIASKEDIEKLFFEEGNWRYLVGTSLSWLFPDFAFCGLGLSSPEIVRHIWSPDDLTPNVYQALRDNSTHSLIMVSIGALVGGAAMIKVIKYASPKTLQLWGFIVLAVLFIVTGSPFTPLLKNGNQAGLIILYVLRQLAFSLGPNVIIIRSLQRSSLLDTDALVTGSLLLQESSDPGLRNYS